MSLARDKLQCLWPRLQQPPCGALPRAALPWVISCEHLIPLCDKRLFVSPASSHRYPFSAGNRQLGPMVFRLALRTQQAEPLLVEPWPVSSIHPRLNEEAGSCSSRSSSPALVLLFIRATGDLSTADLHHGLHRTLTTG